MASGGKPPRKQQPGEYVPPEDDPIFGGTIRDSEIQAPPTLVDQNQANNLFADLDVDVEWSPDKDTTENAMGGQPGHVNQDERPTTPWRPHESAPVPIAE